MKMLPLQGGPHCGDGNPRRLIGRLWICGLAAALFLARGHAQDDQLNKVHVAPSGTDSAAPASEPNGAEAAPATGNSSLKIHPGSFIRMNVDMVLVPVTVTDPMNRLVTGLEKKIFKSLRTTANSGFAVLPAKTRPSPSASSSISPAP